MQGVILSAGSAQGLILGDDGARYTFTPLDWRDSSAGPAAGMRVEFEAQGARAVGIVPIPGAARGAAPGTPAPQQFSAPAAVPGASPARPEPAPPAAGGSAPAQPPSPAPERRGFGSRWWHWALAGGGALAVALVIVGGFVLGFFGTSGPPMGREVARHTHEGRTYVLVEYGNELAIFSDSGAPVGERGLAEDILLSYAWRQVIADFDIEELKAVSQRVQRLDDSVSDARSLSNSVVSIFDDLDDMEANIPLLGSISAMDVVRESFVGVTEAENLIRSLDSELNDLERNAASLTEASARISSVNLASVSGDEMEALFTGASEAARDLESSAGTARESVSQVREAVGDLAAALRAGSDTPLIGDALADFARSADSFESELSGLSGLLGGVESDLGTLGQDLEGALESADSTLQADMERWLAEPYDTQWPPADGERQVVGATLQATSQPGQGAGSTMESQNFSLQWETSASSVSVGESFTLTVRMYDVRQAGEHGGISVSFPTLTQPGGSNGRYSADSADVEALGYTSSLSNVAFHQPGATIYHRENNRQFPAEYLLVESDDPTWSRSDDRTLELRVTPKREGEFPIQIRGWLCADGYTDCARNPAEGAETDQQGWAVEVVSVSVAKPPASAVTPTQTPVPTQPSNLDPAPTGEITQPHTATPTATPTATEAPVTTVTPTPVSGGWMLTQAMPLHRAAYSGEVSEVEALLEQGVGARATAQMRNEELDVEIYLMTPLHLATFNPNPEVAKLLLAWGSNVDAKDNSDRTPLHWAAWNDRPELVGILLEWGANVRAEAYDDRTPLHLAAWNAGPEVVGLLLEWGADFEAVTYGDGTRFWRPLHYAAALNTDMAVAELLLEWGADVMVTTDYGATPLHKAVQHNANADMIDLLLTWGADLEAQYDYDKTPLHYAASALKPEMAARLLDLGANIEARSNNGWTPLHNAAMRLTKLEAASEMIKLLLDRGANIEAQEEQGRTPLLLVVSGYSDLRTPTGERVTGETAAEMIRLLLDQGANIEAEFPYGGWTSLLYAADANLPEGTLVLLDAGADSKAKNSNGQTACQVARQNGSFDGTQLLGTLCRP